MTCLGRGFGWSGSCQNVNLSERALRPNPGEQFLPEVSRDTMKSETKVAEMVKRPSMIMSRMFLLLG